MDRETIEKNDFPVARRGYEPSAVDAHLRLLADEVERLRQGSSSRTETLATAVSERVRGIVEAAEASAADILASAELEARELRREASDAAERARLEATGEAQREAAAKAQDYVSGLSRSISEMLERLDGVGGELDALAASLRTGTERLRGELASLEDELEGVITAPAGEQEPLLTEFPTAASTLTGKEAARPVPAAADFLEPAVESSPESAKIGDVPPEEVDSGDTDASLTVAGPSDDTEGARLIALNMALNGTAREETDRYLAENFDLRDRRRLLDEVYASVEG